MIIVCKRYPIRITVDKFLYEATPQHTLEHAGPAPFSLSPPPLPISPCPPTGAAEDDTDLEHGNRMA
ncbi:unnamed protein product [Nezara viridula]|uniref:Uncharacterized protein n=1 Tax=Nezara viridula TaxID=85310 RepID=A0A9P0MP18_NEZVI|nr:unnamed protein product [Nezara viridula]